MFVLFGAILPAVNNMISHEKPIEPGTVLEVGLGVSFTPVPGWSIHSDITRPGNKDTGGVVAITEMGLLVSVSSEEFEGTLSEYRQLIEARAGKQTNHFPITQPGKTVSTSLGVQGLTEIYNSPGMQDQISLFVSNGIGFTVNAEGPEGVLAQLSDDVDLIIRHIRFSRTGTSL